jgi:outer membrane protein OmpA-like peptidoglycan-associated protein
MKKLLAVLLMAAGCATMPPKELVAARQAYETSRTGATGALNPTELYEARKALETANRYFNEGGDTGQVRDWAYVAHRQIQVADAHARAELERRQLAEVARQTQSFREQQMQTTQRQLYQTREQLAEQQRNRETMTKDLESERQRSEHTSQDLANTAAQLETERQARADAETRLQDVTKQLEAAGQVKEESRGVVLTLSGSVLFAPGKSTLLPTAQSRLEQVAPALTEQTKEHRITVEGHTDSLGSDDYNQQLSLSRANAVREYLISKGVPQDRIEAKGLGESRPLVENDTPEKRANNRRVEIVIEPKPVS